MMDVQRAATIRSLSHTSESPYMRCSDIKVGIPLTTLTADGAAFQDILSRASSSTSTTSTAPIASLEHSSCALGDVVSSFEEGDSLVPDSMAIGVGEDQLFAAYAAEVEQPHNLTDSWDAYDPASVMSLTSMSPTLKQSATSGRQGVKRPLERTTMTTSTLKPVLRTGVKDCSINLDIQEKTLIPSPRTTTRRTAKKATPSSSNLSSAQVDMETAKKIKVSRERQLKINAASRRCRKKQKQELQFLRTHVVDLQQVIEEQMRTLPEHASNRSKLSMILNDSRKQVESMGSSARSTKAVSEEEEEPISSGMSAERRQSLLHIASFMRTTMSLESLSFSPEVIACLPIQMDGWHLRLAITEKNYTIHNTKFFPCRVSDLYAFGWETLISSGTITGMMGNPSDEYCVVTPIDKDVAHVYSKTVGKWSLSVHGVANVSYSSLVSRSFNMESERGMICQQSVLEDKDFQDETTIPWLCKRWVVFQSHTQDGVEGTLVEAYRTASYATGRRIYKEHNTYDSFCEHLIRRYAESNSLLERMMARDSRFRQMHPKGALDEVEPVTSSDRVVKSLLLF